MKKIEAIIRVESYENLKKGLNEIGVDFFTFWDVRGCGKDSTAQMYRGILYNTSNIERRMVTIIVNDVFLEKTISCILKHGATGSVGDGKIFVSDIEDAIRIRNGERGPSAIYNT